MSAPVKLEFDHKVAIITRNRPEVHTAINEAMLPPWVDALEECRTNSDVAVNGLASGAGVDVSLQCDIRFAARSASLRVSYTAFGLVPGNGGTYF